MEKNSTVGIRVLKGKFIQLLHEDSVPTSQKTYCISFTIISQLMISKIHCLFRKPNQTHKYSVVKVPTYWMTTNLESTTNTSRPHKELTYNLTEVVTGRPGFSFWQGEKCVCSS